MSKKIKDSGHLYVGHFPKLNGHVLLSPPKENRRNIQLWRANKYGSGLTYKNTILEFIRNLNIGEIIVGIRRK